jgi:hypothetical protein
MTKSVKRTLASPAYLVRIYNAAKATGETTVAMIALLRSAKLVWGDTDLIGPIATAFKEGRLSGSLGVGREEAKRVLALKAWDKDKPETDKHRTHAQHQAYRAAISAWSYCAQQAGMPHVNGGKRKPKARNVPPAIIVADNKSMAPVVLERVIVPLATTFKDVQTFAHNMSALMLKFEQKNAKVVGEYGALFDDFRKAVKTLAGKEAAVSAIKPTGRTV